MNHGERVNHQSVEFSAQEFDGLESFLSKHYVKIDLLNKNAESLVASKIDISRLPNTCISHLQYAPAIVMKMEADQARYNLSIPSKGSFELQIGSRALHGHQMAGTLSSPMFSKRITLAHESCRYNLSFYQCAMVNMLEQLLGRTLSAPLEFEPELNFRTTTGQHLKSLLDQFIDSTATLSGGLDHDLVSRQFEQLIISMLLCYQPHNYSKLIESPMPSPSSADVKRVLDYIHTHIDETILISDLITIAGVPGRTLFDHFRRFTGQSPFKYITHQRLKHVRQDLINREGVTSTVTHIATRWGFSQLGRFAGLYKKTYGETPSETLKRASQNKKLFNYH